MTPPCEAPSHWHSQNEAASMIIPARNPGMARPKSKIDFRLLAKLSKLYYKDNLHQDEIVFI
jgi:hypothetical protein